MKKIILFLYTIFLVSCLNKNSQIIEDLEAIEFQNLINKSESIIIDVRTPEEFNSKKIINSTNIDFYSDNFTDKLSMVRKDVPIYVYCKSGRRSSLAASKMEKLGFTKVYNLVGGLDNWGGTVIGSIQSNEEKISLQPIFTVSEIEDILKNNQLVLINFSTMWCVPCKKMKPVIEEIKNENSKIKVLFIDADINKELLKKYQIMAIPSFLLFKNTNEFFRHVGVISKEELLKKLN